MPRAATRAEPAPDATIRLALADGRTLSFDPRDPVVRPALLDTLRDHGRAIRSATLVHDGRTLALARPAGRWSQVVWQQDQVRHRHTDEVIGQSLILTADEAQVRILAFDHDERVIRCELRRTGRNVAPRW